MSALQGKIAIVTGAGSGMGAATARLLAANGAQVVCSDRSGLECDTAGDIGPSALALNCDVADAEQVRELVGHTLDRWGRLDVMCNAAGIVDPTARPIADYDIDEFDRVVSVNLRGTFLCMKFGIAAMLQTGSGCIVNWASLTSFIGVATAPGYGASKGGVAMLTKSAAVAYAKDSIRVNALVPGVIRTPILKQSRSAGFDVDPGAQNAFASRIAMGRLGTPEEAAQLALFLVSDASSYITGALVPLDGGFLAS